MTPGLGQGQRRGSTDPVTSTRHQGMLSAQSRIHVCSFLLRAIQIGSHTM